MVMQTSDVKLKSRQKIFFACENKLVDQLYSLFNQSQINLILFNQKLEYWFVLTFAIHFHLHQLLMFYFIALCEM